MSLRDLPWPLVVLARPIAISGGMLVAVVVGGSLSADTVELSGGGHVSGDVARSTDRKTVIVQLDDEIRVALPGSRVRRVVSSDRLAEYEKRAIEAGNDAQRHYELGVWCVKVPNFPGDSNHYKRFHMLRAIEIDPDHSEARASLGYKKEKGKWVRTADLFRRRGMVRDGLNWQLPEAVAIKERREAAERASKLWGKDIARLTAIIKRASSTGKNNSKSVEAWDKLAALEDPLAANAVARQLEDSRENRDQPRELRRLWVKLLGRFRNGESVRALVLAGIEEPDDIIREAALEQLQQYGSSSAIATYLPQLKSNDNATVNRAARALSWFPDPELALTYVDALVTTHTKEVLPGAGTQAGFSNDGSGGFSTGGKKTVIKTTKQNPPVLGLLNEIEPEANYGYDEPAWREHFASKLTAYEGDLRRDP